MPPDAPVEHSLQERPPGSLDTEQVDRVIQILDGRVTCDDGPVVCALPA